MKDHTTSRRNITFWFNKYTNGDNRRCLFTDRKVIGIVFTNLTASQPDNTTERFLETKVLDDGQCTICTNCLSYRKMTIFTHKVNGWIRDKSPHFTIAFALGLITSLLIRGFGTSYWAGWESTWLADSPATVKNFLDYTYGIIPSIGGLPAMPDLDAVVAMRADNLPYLKEAPSAAPWLIRMMLFMVLVVVLPRLVLVLFDTWRIRRFHNHVLIDLDDPYFADILVQCAEDAALGRLIIVTSTIERAQREQTVTRVRRYWGQEADSDVVAMDFDDPEAAVAAINGGERRTVVALWLDAVQTPEVDTHGLVIEKLRAACDMTPGTVFAGLLDLTEFSEHFRGLSSRIKERGDLWSAFAQSRGLTLFVLKPGADEQLAAIKKLRGWAAAQTDEDGGLG